MGRITHGPGPSTIIPKAISSGETIVYVDKPVEIIQEKIVYRDVPVIQEVPLIKEVPVIQEKVVIEYRDVPVEVPLIKEVEKIVYIDKPVVKIKEIIKPGPERIVHVEDITRIRELENRNKQLESRLNKAGVIVILLVMSLILGVMYVQ